MNSTWNKISDTTLCGNVFIKKKDDRIIIISIKHITSVLYVLFMQFSHSNVQL